MSQWKMLTLVGEDQPGIVAAVTEALYRAGWNLGEASMMRLGESFAILLMITGEGDADAVVAPVAERLDLRYHIDPVRGGLHRHQVPNFQVRVNCADRAGIVAQVAGILAQEGFNILELESDVAGNAASPVYIMIIQGYCDRPLEQLEEALAALHGQGVDVEVSSVETLIG